MVQTSYKDIINEGRGFEYIPYDRIKANPLNTYEIENIETLKDEILTTRGLVTPLSVIGPNEDGDYILISGERRLNAIGILREQESDIYDSLPCFIIGPANMGELEQTLAIELSNIAQRNDGEAKLASHRLHVIGCLDEMKKADDEETRNLSVLAAESLSVSPRYARSYTTVHGKAIDPIKELIGTPISDTDKRSVLPVIAASKIAGMDEATQKKIAEEIKNGTKYKDAIDKYTTKEETPSSEEEPEVTEAGKNQYTEPDDHPVPYNEPNEDEYDDEYDDEYEDDVYDDEDEDDDDVEETETSQSEEGGKPDRSFEDLYKSFQADETDDFDPKAFADLYNQTKYADGMYARDDYSGDEIPIPRTSGTHHDDYTIYDADVSEEEVILFLSNMLEKEELTGREEEIVELCEQIVSKFTY